ncbi:MAG TPA: hypothetical protein VGF70_15370 [Solirubrobacteraceae bacterium]
MFARLSSPTRPLFLSVLAGIVLAMAGCGSGRTHASGAFKSITRSSTSVTTTTTTTLSVGGSTAPPAPRALVQNATNEVKTLLAVAKPGTTIAAQGTVSGWAPANGSAIPADPSHISGFGFVADKGIQYLAFAVKDTSGKCAGGNLLANAAGTLTTGGKAVSIPAKAPCTGDEVAKLAGHAP